LTEDFFGCLSRHRDQKEREGDRSNQVHAHV
jgi:hypothetical protein